LGAPNLTDKIWLYGGSIDTVMETINKGRTNQMPAHKTILTEGKIHLLAAYVWGLSNKQKQGKYLILKLRASSKLLPLLYLLRIMP
jgi:cytochrome c oxidase cbb3-type subunit 3